MTASTTSCVSRHGGEVAASNPALLTCTRSPRAQAACPSSAAAHASPRSLLPCSCAPPQPRTPDHSHYIVLYYGRPLSLGFHRHLRHPPRYGASRRSSTGLYGPVAAGTPASPRPRPSLFTPAHLPCCMRRPRSAMCAPPHAQDPPRPFTPASLRVPPPQERPENKLRARE